ncbi:MAG: transporter, partial [Myxococcota bacterium]
MNHRSNAIAAALVLSLTATESRAQADTIDSTEPTVDINIFHPTPGARNFFSTESGNVNTHLGVSAGININFANTPLNVRVVTGDSESDVGAVVPYRVDAVALAAIGLFDVGELGVAFPLVLQGSADDSVPGELPGLFETDVPGFASGDLRIVPKVRLYNGQDDVFSAAIVPTVIVPTGGADYARENNLVFSPALALSSTNGPLRVGLNLGYRLRDKTRIPEPELGPATLIVDDEYFARLAGGFDLSGGEGGFELIGEVYGHTPVANPFAINSEGTQADIQSARTTLEGL